MEEERVGGRKERAQKKSNGRERRNKNNIRKNLDQTKT